MGVRRDALLAALQQLAGMPRLLIYDLSEEQAPHRADAASPFVRGSDAWWRFVERRRSLDDGQGLNLVISLRGLRTDERLLAVGWGTAFANSFLLIEPADPWLDLTTAEGLAEYEKQCRCKDASSLVRAAYAEWNYWVHDSRGELETRAATLNVEAKSTLWQELGERLQHTFPAESFLSSLTLLTLRETELFAGGSEVIRSAVPFLTRLGLPILHDPRHVLRGVRQLVNAGLTSVQDPRDHGRVYRGPQEPLPREVSDERLAMMVR